MASGIEGDQQPPQAQLSWRARKWRTIAARQPSAFLLAAQLLGLLIYPAIDAGTGGRLLFGTLTLMVVPLALWVVMRSSLMSWIGFLLAIPAMLLTMYCVMFKQESLLSVSMLLEAALYFYAAGGLIIYMMGDQKVTADDLYAAGATFTLLVWGFAYAYLVCQAWYPGSFTGFEPDRDRTVIEMLSYSFANLSATGLGDVLPVNAQARVLTMLEQFAGVGYLATVVSRLIGMTILRKH